MFRDFVFAIWLPSFEHLYPISLEEFHIIVEPCVSTGVHDRIARFFWDEVWELSGCSECALVYEATGAPIDSW